MFQHYLGIIVLIVFFLYICLRTPKSALLVDELVAKVQEETEIYARHGIVRKKFFNKFFPDTFSSHAQDGIILENMHDLPYQLPVDHGPEICSIMTRLCVESVKILGPQRRKDMLFGIQILAGANREAIAVAQAAGLDLCFLKGREETFRDEIGLQNDMDF